MRCKKIRSLPFRNDIFATIKTKFDGRQSISVENAAKMVRATIDTRDRAILLLFFKTGIRRNELITLDLEDLDLQGMSLTLKPTPKRSNRTVFFDDETRRALARWIKSREMRFKKGDQKALFISAMGYAPTGIRC